MNNNVVEATTCLNPCCNGRCSLSPHREQQRQQRNVLILVVMEDAL